MVKDLILHKAMHKIYVKKKKKKKKYTWSINFDNWFCMILAYFEIFISAITTAN